MMNNEGTRSKKVRTGDNVVVIAGNAKGQQGTVIACFDDRVVVQGLNMCKKHVKKSKQHPQGGVVPVERSMHISNVRPCDEQGVPLKVKVRTSESGERELVYLKNGEPVVWRSMKQSKK